MNTATDAVLREILELRFFTFGPTVQKWIGGKWNQ